MCAAATQAGGFLVPWVPAPSPAPAPALGPCVGGPGSVGWRIVNSTGGGGPSFAKFAADSLDEEAVDACRKRCCASPRCASVTMHVMRPNDIGCFLNPANGTVAPYPRALTLMAYVNRQH